MKQKYSKIEAQQQKIKKEGKGFWKRPWLQVGRSQERVGLRQVWGKGSGPVLRGDGGRTQGSAELEGTSVVQGSGNRTPTGSPGSTLEGETVVPFPSNPIPGMFLLISAEPSLDGPHLSVKTLPLPSCISGALGLLASICLPPSLPHPLAPRNPAARGGLRG